MNITVILLLALSFAQNHTYCMYDNCPAGILRYNCADFSAGLTLLLRENNVTAYPMCGWLDHFYHAWVGVEFNNSFYNIEPQSGKIVIPNEMEYVRGRPCVVRGIN